MKTVIRYMIVLALTLFVGMTASAQTNSYPDPSSIYTSLSSPFNAALTWVIGATAVLIVIGWILKAVRRR